MRPYLMDRHEEGVSLLELAMPIGIILAVTASRLPAVHPAPGALPAEP